MHSLSTIVSIGPLRVNGNRRTSSYEQFMNHFPVHIGQAKIAAGGFLTIVAEDASLPT
jgi:hypothetical protein